MPSANSVAVTLSEFAETLTVEMAFLVLATARKLKAGGKDVVELEIGDSPFPTPEAAKQAGERAIRENQSHYCPSPGLPAMREAAARFVGREFGIRVGPENIVVGPGAKIFQQYFCETFLNPGDGVLVFSPHFATFIPNIARRQARPVLAPLRQEHEFRPEIDQIARFLSEDPAPKAIFLNSPHNPTGGVATADDLRQIADLVRGKNVAVFCDEPYCHMVWKGKHHSLLQQPGMLDQCVAAYTFSKSFSMSGWRLGFAVTSARIADPLGKMVNTTLSCTPPLVQLAGIAAMEHSSADSAQDMRRFQAQVELLTAGLNRIEGFKALPPSATFYVFPNVKPVCNRLGITSHGLAMYLLEGADDKFGVACLGGECFGEAGAGFLRFSCAEPNERLQQALDFLPVAISRTDKVAAYLEQHPKFRLAKPYPVTG